MARILSTIKYGALFYGLFMISRKIGYRLLIVDFGSNTYTVMNNISMAIGLYMTIIFYNIDKNGIVKNTVGKKSKLKKILLIIVTLGVIVFIYKKRYEILNRIL